MSKNNNYIEEKVKEFEEEFCYLDSIDGKMKLSAVTFFAENYTNFLRSALSEQLSRVREKVEKVEYSSGFLSSGTKEAGFKMCRNEVLEILDEEIK